jgi:hypothetical protein
MSPITDDEHVDELKERRKVRESRPGSRRAAPPRIPSAEPARDLLGGLITSGSPEGDDNRSAGDQDAADGAPPPAREATSQPVAGRERAESTAPVGGEKIDELIRRVKEGTPADADAATTIERRRPKGTADLSPAAAPRRRRRPTRQTTPSRGQAPRRRRTRLLGTAATLVVAGATVLVFTLSSGPSRLSPARSDSSPTSTIGFLTAFGGSLNNTIAALGPELQPFARRAVSASHPAPRRHMAARQRTSRPHVQVTRHIRRAPRQRSRAVPASSPSTATTVQTQTYAPPPSPVSTTSQTPVSETHSTTSSTRPSGPSGSNPLGGIGSCVKGC